VHNVSNVRRLEVHKAELLVPGPSRLEVENAIANMKKYKSTRSDQIPTELIQIGSKKGDKTDSNNYRVMSLLSTSYNLFVEYSALMVEYVHR
jgi:hypothetical protein